MSMGPESEVAAHYARKAKAEHARRNPQANRPRITGTLSLDHSHLPRTNLTAAEAFTRMIDDMEANKSLPYPRGWQFAG